MVTLALLTVITQTQSQSSTLAGWPNVDDGNYESYFTMLESKEAYIYFEEKTAGKTVKVTFLGNLNRNAADLKSIRCEAGEYGSRYRLESIFNPYGEWGSKYRLNSPFNPYSLQPPMIGFKENGKTVLAGYLTMNEYLVTHSQAKVKPTLLLKWLGREDLIKDLVGD